MATEYDWKKCVYLRWYILLKLPDGRQHVNDLPLLSFEDAIRQARGMYEALNLALGLNINWYNSSEGGGRRYTERESGFEYIYIYCAEGAGLKLKPGDQISIGDFTDYLCANYSWGYEDGAAHHGVRVVGHDTTYHDWWITGNQFYMTNDSKLDSVDLGSINRRTVVEFVALEAITD